MHQENVSKRYDRANWNQSVILFGNFKEKEIEALVIQKQHPIGVPSNMCSENMHQIYRRTPMPKCDLLNLILYELYWNHKMETEILRQKACKATVDAFFEMISTKCAQHPYFKHPLPENIFWRFPLDVCKQWKGIILWISFLYRKGSLENIFEELVDIWGLYYKHDGIITLFGNVLRIPAVIIFI